MAGGHRQGQADEADDEELFDEVVIPHTSGYLTPGPRTTNLTVQDACPWSFVEHVLIPGSRAAIDWTLDALTRPGPARAAYQPRC